MLKTSYWPLSNLAYLSTVFQEMVDNSLETHLSTLDNLEPVYCNSHYPETMHLNVHHHITEVLDNKCMAALVLFDFSVSYGVTDHTILKKHLKYSSGVIRSALSWIQSNLSNRSQYVTVGMSTPEGKCVNFGLPKISNVCTKNKLVKYVADIISSIHRQYPSWFC